MGGVCSFFFGCCGHQTHDPKGTTLVASRGCTDKLLLLLYMVAWAASIAVVSTSKSMGGDPNKIINGINFKGEICGVSSAVKDQPYAALVNPLDGDTLSVWACVSTCNQTKMIDNPNMAIMYGSTKLFGYCIPTFDFSASGSVDLNTQSQFNSEFDSLSLQISRGVSDLANAWQVIMISCFIALFFSYLYIWMTKKFAGVIIWLCILLVIAGGFFVGYSFLTAANDADSGTSTDRIQAYRVAGYIFIAGTSLFVLIILGLSSQIRVAIEVVKEGSRAINDMKSIVFFPLFPLLICAGYFIYWLYGCLYIFSVSDLESQAMPSGALTRSSTLQTWAYYGGSTGYALEGTTIVENSAYNLSTYSLNSIFRPFAAYHVFHLLWTVQFLVYFGYFVIAGAVCGWYFTLSDENGNKITGGKDGGSYAPVLSSIGRTIRYHLGTIAFASLIIAIVQFIRVVVKYIELKTRTNPPNYLQKAVFCIIQCCLKCIECCLDKISKNALIWCAMWGDPFLASACSSFALIWRNLARVAAVHVVSDIILGIGKLAITATTVGICALILQKAEPWKDTVSSAFVPCIFIAIIAYCTAWLFFLTFETVVDCTFMCFLVDSENHEKNGEAMFAGKGLQTLVGKYQQRSAKTAEQEKEDAASLYQHIHGSNHAVADAQPTQQHSAVVMRAVEPPAGTTDGAHRSAWGN